MTSTSDRLLALAALILAAIAASGVFWVCVATAWGLRGAILDALRNE
mgnify:CR=1 FL=1